MGQEEAEARKMEEERQDRRSEERGKKRREELTKQQTMVSNTIEPIRSETSSLIGPQQSSGASTTSAKLSVYAEQTWGHVVGSVEDATSGDVQVESREHGSYDSCSEASQGG